MPLYEYQCDACGHRFDRIQKFSDPLVSICPVCGGPVQKLFSSPAFQFKGSGWYATDYAQPTEKEKEKRSAGDGAAPDAKESSATEQGKKEKEQTKKEKEQGKKDREKGKESGAKESGSGESGAKETGAKAGGGASKDAPADKPAAKAPSKEPS